MKVCLLFLLLALFTSYNYPDKLYVANLPPVVVSAKRLVPSHLQKDWVLLAKLIAAESDNQPFDGKHAVADVVINISKSKGWTISQTIFSKGRFDGIHSKRFSEVPSADCLEAARLAILGKHILPSNVHYFHNAAIATDSKWVRYIEQFPYKQIGDHLFCYDPNNNPRA